MNIFPILDLYLVDSTMWRLLPRLAFMVTARVALKGLWVSFAHLVESRLPFLGGHQQFSLSIFQLEENKYKSENREVKEFNLSLDKELCA